jgi:hypothetical protein
MIDDGRCIPENGFAYQSFLGEPHGIDHQNSCPDTQHAPNVSSDELQILRPTSSWEIFIRTPEKVYLQLFPNPIAVGDDQSEIIQPGVYFTQQCLHLFGIDRNSPNRDAVVGAA